MEAIAATMEGELNCLGDIFTNEEADFMAQLLGSSSGYGVSSNGDNNFNLRNLSSNYSIITSQESYYLMSESSNPGSGDSNKSFSFDFSMDDHTNTSMSLLECNGYPNGEMTKDGNVEEFSKTEMDQTLKKRPVEADNASKVEKTKRNVRPKKNPKVSGSSSSSNNEEECNGRPNGPGPGPGASISCCSEDDSNVSLNSNGKARASRGSATDPQSLYARKRRERINERLRILQNLVPNGTKVDISTMLEEAVNYVKFLQLQIKLLSSDDLWMYAPLAYNGMDIGLDLKLIAASR